MRQRRRKKKVRPKRGTGTKGQQLMAVRGEKTKAQQLMAVRGKKTMMKKTRMVMVMIKGDPMEAATAAMTMMMTTPLVLVVQVATHPGGLALLPPLRAAAIH